MWKLPLVMAVVAALTLAGCHSSKNSAGKGIRYEDGIYGGDRHSHKPMAVPDKVGKALTKEAKKWIGTPYANGGHSRRGTDCSGMVMEVYKEVTQVKLPRSSREMEHYCVPVPRKEASEGDLVFFSSNKSSAAISHVGLYIGNGEMIHASSSQGVMISPVDTGYWGKRYFGTGRVGAIASVKEKKEKREKKKEAAPAPAPVPVPTSTPVPVPVREITVQQLAKATEKPKEPLPQKTENAVQLYELTIDQKVDSICASFFE